MDMNPDQMEFHKVPWSSITIGVLGSAALMLLPPAKGWRVVLGSLIAGGVLAGTVPGALVAEFQILGNWESVLGFVTGVLGMYIVLAISSFGEVLTSRAKAFGNVAADAIEKKIKKR